MKYRMYVDEVGNSDLGASNDPNHRYLSLTGVIFSLEYVDRVVFPMVEDMKRRYFGSHPDDPVIFHRKELVNKKPPFTALTDPAIEQSFNQELLGLLKNLEYVAITAVIDKLEHQRRYSVWRFDPYHYCLTVLVERYVRWLARCNAQGDVMAESRGGKEDRRLKDSFERVYEKGSDYVPPDQFSARLTSRQLKVKAKSNNIAGLQIADLIAHPSFRATLARRENQALPTNFGGKIAQILEHSKYNRGPRGQIDGWGRKWLP
ncbi:MAG: DUF3800 domain-containing protein [Chloroflexia bacterium]|nr:DUF3800 domain-containing protein [Chloroflexia bacterium]